MALECKDVGFHYNTENWLFRNVDLRVGKGEIVGIIGYSGCGKTSLSKLLADYLIPSEGEILIDGEKHKKGEFKKVQLIYQHPEKIMNPRWKMKEILSESYEPEQKILDKFGIRNEWFNRYPIELSGGEMQRFSIVRSLNPKTEYLIADEMTTMLDGLTQAFIWKQLLEIVKTRNIGLIIISHEKDIIKKLCDRCYYMSDQKVEEINIDSIYFIKKQSPRVFLHPWVSLINNKKF
ncbi:MAG: ATP-binding cassette domain-containing protein [Andreesenia angusta]|nr:ATP-binding cassette domain-containing protein [Andreesenia angusta]